ncbi:MAG: hypothetical protein KTR25_01540 [Myxococcales bacterium]|nr:hypothetical protein [Myxococcales bacterium]
MSDIEGLTPRGFCNYLKMLGRTRAFFVWDGISGQIRSSHPQLAPFARTLLASSRDFDEHEAIFLEVSPRTGVLMGAFVHRTCRGQGAGGIRYFPYDSLGAYLVDGLRLAQGMTLKNALAGLWWGGAKGVISGDLGVSQLSHETRRKIFEDYGAFLSGLSGCYVAAEDVGTTEQDMAAVFARTRFTTCIPVEFGGSGNPSFPTARGVVRGMEAALAHQNQGTLRGKKVAIQGLGHVGQALIRLLHQRGVSEVVASDLDPKRANRVRQQFPELRLTFRQAEREWDPLLEEPADILSLNAVGGMLNEANIARIRAPIVCGAANNQLADPEVDDQFLHNRQILYVPDFVVNRMGIVCCADEANGMLVDDPNIERHLGEAWDMAIYPLILRILQQAEAKTTTPHRIALGLARERSRELHPLMGHRGYQLVQGLVTQGWADATVF